MPSYRERGQMADQMAALLPLYGGEKTNVIETALALLHQRHYPAEQSTDTRLLSLVRVVLRGPWPCYECGELIGPQGWQELTLAGLGVKLCDDCAAPYLTEIEKQ